MCSLKHETPQHELGVQFSTLRFDDNQPIVRGGIAAEFKNLTRPGLGGRYTYNLNDHFSFEVEANFFIGKTNTFAPIGSDGHAVEIVSGIQRRRRISLLT